MAQENQLISVSSRYAAMVWLSSVVVGSLLFGLLNWFNVHGGGYLLALVPMSLMAALFSFLCGMPVYLAYMLLVCLVHPRRIYRHWPVRLCMGLVAAACSGIMLYTLFLLVLDMKGAEAMEMLACSAGYPLAAMVTSWAYPLGKITWVSGGLRSGVAETLAAQEEHDEQVFFGKRDERP